PWVATMAVARWASARLGTSAGRQTTAVRTVTVGRCRPLVPVATLPVTVAVMLREARMAVPPNRLGGCARCAQSGPDTRVGGDARAHARQDPCSGLGWVAQRPGRPWCPGRLRRRRRGCCVDRGRRVPATADGVVLPGPGGPRCCGGGADRRGPVRWCWWAGTPGRGVA